MTVTVQIVRVSAELPRGAVGKHLAGQMIRSGSAPAANDAAARSAESTNDSIHQIQIAPKAPNETRLWLEIGEKSG